MASRRIAVLGPPGSGKSTLARTLAEVYTLPITHIDTLAWSPGWVVTPDDVLLPQMKAVIDRPAWVIDGNYRRVFLEDRIERADLVIFLDLPRWLCMARIVKRRVGYAGRSRPDIAEGCPERIGREFWAWAWHWGRVSRPGKVALLARKDAAKVVWIRSRAELRSFLRSLPA